MITAEQVTRVRHAGAPLVRQRVNAQTRDKVLTVLLWLTVVTIISVLAGMLLYIMFQGIGLISWKFLTSASVTGDYVGPQLFNTFYIVGLALLLSTPISVGAAIYLVEYARQGRFVAAVRFASETMAGIPSIILGLFGFLLFVTRFGEGSFMGFSRLAGALTLTLLNLPILLRVSEDALRSVPNELREASLALGASKIQTIARVIIPSAVPALATGVILTAGKMLGETAALVFTAGGNSSINGWFSLNPLVSGDTLTVHLYQLQAEGVARNAVELKSATAALLILLLLACNVGLRAAARLLNRYVLGTH